MLLTSGFHWEWDDHCKSSGLFLTCNNRKVNFYSDYSCGTAAIRGTKELTDGHHYWEIKMTSPVYGTDMVSIVSAVACIGASWKRPPVDLSFLPFKMVGIGTLAVDLNKFSYTFGSLLGLDEDSWGLSYTGQSPAKHPDAARTVRGFGKFYIS